MLQFDNICSGQRDDNSLLDKLLSVTWNQHRTLTRAHGYLPEEEELGAPTCLHQ